MYGVPYTEYIQRSKKMYYIASKNDEKDVK